MARTAPQLNIMSVGFALRLAVGLLALVVFLPELATRFVAMFTRDALHGFL
jgi:flagellar biosynthesis protein FliR